MIEPTIGRVVWFRTREMDDDNIKQAFAAIVTYVHSPRMVNLALFEPSGYARGQTSVTLLQDDDKPHGEPFYCMWMPFQIGQAKKHETDKAV